MNPLVKSARDHRVGYDEVEALESRQTRKEIPVRGSQPMTIGRMIADGDHEMSPRASRGAGEQRRPQQVLVVASGRLDEPLEVPERADQKPCLAHEAFGAAVVSRARLERAKGQPLERIHILQVETQRIVETHDLGNQPWPKPERRLVALVYRHAAGHAGEHFALRLGEPHAVAGESIPQARDQVARRHDVGHDQRRALRENSILNRPKQIGGGRARGRDDETVARVERRPVATQRDDGLAERLEIGDPHEPGCAGRNRHL